MNLTNFACKICSSNNRYKSAKGMCSRCYKRTAYQNNPERARQVKRKWVKKHKKHVYRMNTQYKLDHPEWYKQVTAKSRKKTRLKNNYADVKSRKKRVVQHMPKWLTKEHRRQIREFYKNCPKGYHVDHIIPLKSYDIHTKQHVSCGLHVPWNLQYLSKSDNLKKGHWISLKKINKLGQTLNFKV